jgi:transposase
LIVRTQAQENTLLHSGVRVVFLPPYSPHLNPIEEAISKIKAFIRRNYDLFTPGDEILYDVKIAMEIITPQDAEGYFFHAGYF